MNHLFTFSEQGHFFLAICNIFLFSRGYQNQGLRAEDSDGDNVFVFVSVDRYSYFCNTLWAVFAKLLLCCGRQPCGVERGRALRLGLQAKTANFATWARTLNSNYPSRGYKLKIVDPWNDLLESDLYIDPMVEES
jgi:hypothetical protein